MTFERFKNRALWTPEEIAEEEANVEEIFALLNGLGCYDKPLEDNPEKESK